MPHTLEEVRQIAFELPEEERLALASALWDTLSDDLEPEVSGAEFDASWEPEIARRIAEIKAGQAVTYSLEEVEASLRAIVGR